MTRSVTGIITTPITGAITVLITGWGPPCKKTPPSKKYLRSSPVRKVPMGMVFTPPGAKVPTKKTHMEEKRGTIPETKIAPFS